MKKLLVVTAALVLLSLSIFAQANITIDTVTVGDAGNAGQLSGQGAGGFGPDRICGSVGYNYNIGKYEVTAGQYTAFLNAKAKTDIYGLYNTNMDTAYDSYGCNIKRTGPDGNYNYTVASDWANRPVNNVSYWDSCRFTNWLGNGQGTGSTETGAYTLNRYNGQDGRTIQRNAGWKWAVTSEDEWYKAAYYKGGSTNAGYWLYPTQSNSISTGMANYDYTVRHITDVGSYGFSSAYGTFDQGGNVWEWNEAIVYQGTNYAERGGRGGSFDFSDSGYTLQSSSRNYSFPNFENDDVFGFRVSEVVPEPSSIITLAVGLLGLMGIIKRKG